jgi:hypothetical protein
MKKILFRFILISLSILISSCDKECDCEYVISSYNHSTSEWEETSRYDQGGNCVDETILETKVYDTTSTIISLHGLKDTTYEVEPGVNVYIWGPLSTGGWDFVEDTTYDIELISGYKEELDCVTWGGI